MKNMSKRTKMILAIVGVVVVVAIAVGVVMIQTPSGELSGAASNLVITPTNPTVPAGNSTVLSVNATYNCAWSSSDTNIVSLVNYTSETKSVTVQGIANGSATITAKCGMGSLNVNKVTTTVTVSGATLVITPSNPVVHTGRPPFMVTLSVNSTSTCVWSIANTNILSFYGPPPQPREAISATVMAREIPGSTTVSAVCGIIHVPPTTVNVVTN